MKNKGEQTITVNASKNYEVIIGKGLLERVGEYVKKISSAKKVAVITDDTVCNLYFNCVLDSLTESGFEVENFVFPHGEKSKNINTYASILEFLAKKQFTRTDLIVALGGGVVGDMAGFVAATYLRGIAYVQVPTTLLSQIDSSVGGKTAIDLEEGKNLVGAFYQPSLVLCDVNALKTLPKEVYLEGMGEMSKYAVLDEKTFNLLQNDGDISQLIYCAVDYKRKIVEEDEFEGGRRRLLNLGHTLAHGIEKLSNYSIPHGKAVAMGLKIILDNSFRHSYIDEKTYQKIRECLVKNNIYETSPYSVSDLCRASLNDKKRSGNIITLLMIHGIGDVRDEKVDVSKLDGFLR